MKYPKSRTENNRGAAYLRGREARMAVELERRSQIKEECRYCDLVLRKEVVRYASEENRSFKTIPCGWVVE